MNTAEAVGDILIRVYVPEAEQMPYQQALDLALERNEAAARNLYQDAMDTQLDLAAAAKVSREERVKELLEELGYD